MTQPITIAGKSDWSSSVDIRPKTHLARHGWYVFKLNGKIWRSSGCGLGRGRTPMVLENRGGLHACPGCENCRAPRRGKLEQLVPSAGLAGVVLVVVARDQAIRGRALGIGRADANVAVRVVVRRRNPGRDVQEQVWKKQEYANQRLHNAGIIRDSAGGVKAAKNGESGVNSLRAPRKQTIFI